MSLLKRTSSEWFKEAARCYVERHQGCPWCGGSHRLYKTRKGTCLEYSCMGCDFLASYDEDADTYALIPGEKNPATPSPVTMLEI
jgi:hypothetical protein